MQKEERGAESRFRHWDGGKAGGGSHCLIQDRGTFVLAGMTVGELRGTGIGCVVEGNGRHGLPYVSG